MLMKFNSALSTIAMGFLLYLGFTAAQVVLAFVSQLLYATTGVSV